MDGRPSTELNRLYWAFRPHFGRYSFQLLQNSVGSKNVLKIQRKNHRLSLGQIKSPQHMSLNNITVGKKVAKKGIGAGGINGVKLSFALASAKLHLSPHVPVFLTPGH